MGFDSTGEECARGRPQLHSENLYCFYCSTDVVRLIRSRKLGWNGSVALTGMEEYLQILVELPDDKRLLVKHVWYMGK
jgi:hypothetical protein